MKERNRGMDEREVTISLSRFEQLLDAETRLNILEDKLINDSSLYVEDALRIIGSIRAIKKADGIKEENERQRKKYLAENDN